MKKKALRLKNIDMNFEQNDGLRVLDNINISVNKDEFVCLLGPSGSGKTVLLFLIAGFLKPTRGQIFIDGQETYQPNTDRIMVFQDYVLFPWMTVSENILFGLTKSHLSRPDKQALRDKYLEMVGLTKFKNSPVTLLSGGMKQRVALARAFIANPKILLMDEPFAALDSQNRKFIRRSLAEIWEKTKKTVIFVTHSVSEAVELSDTIYLLSGQPAKIKNTYKIDIPRPRNPQSREFLKIYKKIEREISKEYEKDGSPNIAGNVALKQILKTISKYR
jgi:NitT/TauT family transport system ATP-binding protein